MARLLGGIDRGVRPGHGNGLEEGFRNRVGRSQRQGLETGSWWALAGLCVLWGTLGCVSIDLWSSGASAPLQESVVRGEEGPKILLLDIDGVIGSAIPSPSLFRGEEISMIARTREALDRARADDEIAGVLLRIDSPGGTVTESEQIHTELLRFKRERQVPIVAQLLGTAASGGYYIAMAADVVQAHPTTVTGSIGVIYSSLNFSGLMDKLGIEDQTITGGEFKDAGSPFRRLTDAERAQLQAIVDDLHARFREVVVAGRPDLTTEEVETLANGRIYSARQALENGLVDRLGTLEDAVDLLEDEIGSARTRVVAYHRPSRARRNLYMKSSEAITARSAASALETIEQGLSRPAAPGLAAVLSRPGFHYLWWPGLGN